MGALIDQTLVQLTFSSYSIQTYPLFKHWCNFYHKTINWQIKKLGAVLESETIVDQAPLPEAGHPPGQWQSTFLPQQTPQYHKPNY